MTVKQPATAFAPGRVNLIGEHTDYNQGLALPFAIVAGITVTATHTGGDDVQVIASDLAADDRFALRDPGPARGWRAFARGAVAELSAVGCELVGARLEISGSVPRGSGLSSSAALSVSLCLALLAVSDSPAPGRLELARICSRIENDWVGSRTGLLDQLASLYGQPGRALMIDFRSLEVSPVALTLGGWRLVTLDSGRRHANATDAADGYNRRRAECAQACELLGIESLREATIDSASELPESLRRRALHVITENDRVRETVIALQAGDLERVGALLNESHVSLRDRFEVSTPAVERTVTRLLSAGACGARIVGGGFGGHVLGLLPPDARLPDGAIEVTPEAGARLL
jgi:galactokinase